MYWSFALLGAANLVPWMAFLALSDYFHQFYNSNAMEFYFPAISTFALVATSALLLAFGSQLSFNARIATPTLVMTISLLAVPTLDALVAFALISRDLAFCLTLFSVLLNATFSAATQNSLYALGSLISDTATQAVQAGSGAIGVASVALRIATKLGLPPAPAMWLFCLLGSATLLASLLAYSTLVSEPEVWAKLESHEQRRAMRHTAAKGANDPRLQPMLAAENGSLQRSSGASGSSNGLVSANGGGGGHGSAYVAAAPSVLSVFRLVYVEATCVFSVFTVCLATFPGLTTSLESTAGLGTWYPILLVLAYNSGDLLGKTLPSRLRCLTSAGLPYCTALHMTFLPAFLALAHPEVLPPMLRSDGGALCLTLALGVSTGYIGCMALMLGAERAVTPDEKEVAGMVTSFSLMMGLASGSAAGVVLERLGVA